MEYIHRTFSNLNVHMEYIHTNSRNFFFRCIHHTAKKKKNFLSYVYIPYVHNFSVYYFFVKNLAFFSFKLAFDFNITYL